MLTRDIMTKNVRVTYPGAKLTEVVKIMERENLGFLPVAHKDRLVGTITDRDIALRATTNPTFTTVVDVMTDRVYYCYEDQKIEDTVNTLGELNLRRMPVLNRNKRLTGLFSLSDLKKSRKAWKEAYGKLSDFRVTT